MPDDPSALTPQLSQQLTRTLAVLLLHHVGAIRDASHAARAAIDSASRERKRHRADAYLLGAYRELAMVTSSLQACQIVEALDEVGAAEIGLRVRDAKRHVEMALSAPKLDALRAWCRDASADLGRLQEADQLLRATQGRLEALA